MKKATQGAGLCMVIGMMVLGKYSTFAQDIAKTTPFSLHKNYRAEVKALTIGEQVPDLQFQNVLNYKSKTAKLSDFKGKLIILDMWSTWCTSCIASFPKMEALQNKFKDKLQILLVNPYTNSDPEEKIKTTLDKLKKRTNFYPSLPIPIHDSILNTYFPHESVPHQVWIDADRKIIAITSSNSATEENIKSVIEGKSVSLPVKNDWAINYEKPLLVDENGGPSDDFVFRSLFTRYKNSVGNRAGFRTNAKDEVVGYYYINYPIKALIYDAYSNILKNYRRATTVFDVKNPLAFKNDYDTAYTYCYDLTISPIDAKLFDIKKYLRKDLECFFNISVQQGQRLLKSEIIKVKKGVVFPHSKFEKSEADFDNQSVKKYFHNYSLAEILKILEYHFGKPFIDETGINYKIDLDFPDSLELSNREAVLSFLSKIGFEVKEEQRLMDVAIVTDK
jgi:thiol-disulfide isomerase/thioredoxin